MTGPKVPRFCNYRPRISAGLQLACCNKNGAKVSQLCAPAFVTLSENRESHFQGHFCPPRGLVSPPEATKGPLRLLCLPTGGT